MIKRKDSKAKKINFSSLDYNQKTNCIKNLLYNTELTEALDTILMQENKELVLCNIIIDCLKDETISNKIKDLFFLTSIKEVETLVYSKIISILAFYKKNVILSKLLNSLEEEKLKELAIFEYKNKTEVSISCDIFKKKCNKYKNLATNEINEEFLELTTEYEKYANKSFKSSKKPVVIACVFTLFIIIIGILGFKYYNDSKILSKYKNKILPGIYLDDVDLSNMSYSKLKDLIDDRNGKLKSGKFIIKNINGEISYSYEEAGVIINDQTDLIINYNENLARYKKVMLIKNKKKHHKVFHITANYDDKKLVALMDRMKNDLNTSEKEDSFTIDKNYNVVYTPAKSSFVLDESKTRKDIIKSLKDIKEEIIIDASGSFVKVEAKHSAYKDINKKVASYTTYFQNYGNRGHNIVLAASRLNGTLLKPGETFSYIKRVGPFLNNGYLPASAYINKELGEAYGGGVCQLASTLYMANLYAGLEIVKRSPHTFQSDYVPGGLDATIFAPSVDYQFKNNYSYPIYVVSYVRGGALTVDIWTNDKALGNKTYEPYSYYSQGGYLAYLKVFENGKYKEQRFLGKSVYKPHNW